MDPSSTEQGDHKRLIDRLREQSPSIVEEWLKAADDQQGARAHLERFISMPFKAGFVSIGPETIRQLNIFAHKLTLGLFFQRNQRHLPAQGLLWAFWKTKEDVVYSGVPDFLLALLPDHGALIQGKWDTSETFQFRSGGDAVHQTFACLARLRGGLLVGGFAVENARSFDQEPGGWTHPADLLAESATPRFARRDVE